MVDDIVYSGNCQLHKVVTPAVWRDGKLELSLSPAELPECHVLMGKLRDYPNIARVCDLVGSSFYTTTSDKGFVGELLLGPGYIYTPYYPLTELDSFCEEYMACYEAFAKTHYHQLSQLMHVEMLRFWG
ncbi:hypothetical protein TUMSATVNIG1_61340 (plasmid) [Vibrio nigripulchritudo]|nr:hypothetical protein VNTUMSATTG_60870 [Vibrio nigripulchritudo]BDU35525.1 hypothetical protein TUMSATVNIG1_61340 [Vibrio nigripulchritudo]